MRNTVPTRHRPPRSRSTANPSATGNKHRPEEARAASREGEMWERLTQRFEGDLVVLEPLERYLAILGISSCR